MYRIMMDSALFFDPRVDGYPLGNPKLIREANKIGTLTFTIYPPHPAYGEIKMLTTVFSVYKDGNLIYQGRPAYSKRTFRNGIEYKCEELTAVMNDFQFRPVAFQGGTYQFFSSVISSANNYSGHIGFNPGDALNIASMDLKTDYTGHWEALQKYLVSPYGGYIIPRYENSMITLDYLSEESLPESSQMITFGENMKDMFLEMDSQDTYSGIIPLGGIPSGETEKVNIKSVNYGMDVVYHAEAVDLYGPREVVREWKDVLNPGELKELGMAWLRENAIKFRQTVQISAVDLHNADFSIESFEYLHWIRAVSARHNLENRYVLAREEVPLDRPTGTVLTLGTTRRTYSESMM